MNAEALLLRAARTLAARFSGVFTAETVERCVLESYLALKSTAKVDTYLPILAEHFAADQLTALAQSRGRITKPAIEVLFICSRNAGRSQMAAALMTHHARGRVHVRSAGSSPASEVDPVVVKAIEELGIPMRSAMDPIYPKPLTDDVVQAADVVITMGCGDACPIYPGKRYRNWDLEDPQGRDLADVRRIRDEVGALVRDLLDEIAPAVGLIPASRTPSEGI